MTSEYIQFGCGLSCPEGWANFDSSPRLRIERLPIVGHILRASGNALFPKNVMFGDIVLGLPVAKQSARGAFCSHVLEHIDRSSVSRALENTFRVLQPGGVFRLVVPDLDWRANEFVKAHQTGDSEAADLFMRRCYLGQSSPRHGIVEMARQAYGNSEHRWMYDEAAMISLLANAGFVEIRRCRFGDAEDPAFASVEELGRFIDCGHDELALEARRPT
jgi:SAM-dependent methyltransferase